MTFGDQAGELTRVPLEAELQVGQLGGEVITDDVPFEAA